MPVDGKAFLSVECAFRTLGALPRHSVVGSFAAQRTSAERGHPTGAAVVLDLDSALGAAPPGALALETGPAGRDPLGLTRIRADLVFGTTRVFERDQDLVPTRARGARQ